MSKLLDFVIALDEVKDIEKSIQPLQEKLDQKRKVLSELNEQLKSDLSLRNFLSMKILETYSEEESELVKEHHKRINGLSFNYNSNFDKLFDPVYDEWYIFDYEIDENHKIRFKVSCNKNEGSISGIFTILDVHYTNWFYIDEYKENYFNLPTQDSTK